MPRMPNADFLNAVIDDGIEECRMVYGFKNGAGEKLRGALEGFSLCRDKTPEQIRAIHVRVAEETIKVGRLDAENYWYYRYREMQVEWVAGVLSARVMHSGEGRMIVRPSSRHLLKVMEILELDHPD